MNEYTGYFIAAGILLGVLVALLRKNKNNKKKNGSR